MCILALKLFCLQSYNVFCTFRYSRIWAVLCEKRDTQQLCVVVQNADSCQHRLHLLHLAESPTKTSRSKSYKCFLTKFLSRVSKPVCVVLYYPSGAWEYYTYSSWRYTNSNPRVCGTTFESARKSSYVLICRFQNKYYFKYMLSCQLLRKHFAIPCCLNQYLFSMLLTFFNLCEKLSYVLQLVSASAWEMVMWSPFSWIGAFSLVSCLTQAARPRTSVSQTHNTFFQVI